MPSPARPRNPFAPPQGPTLAHVLAALDRPAPAERRDLPDLKSAVRTVARVLHQEPGALPAHPGFLRARLARISPAAHGLAPARWANVRSLLGKALRLAGIDLLPGRYLAPLTAPWRALWAALGPSKRLRCGLSRLMHYASAEGLLPDEIDDAVLRRFRAALEEESLVRDPRQVHQEAIRTWNKALALVPGWPQTTLAVPRHAQPYTLALDLFPASLGTDLARWLARLEGLDLLEEIPFRPVRAATVERRQFQVRQLASALVQRGRDPASLQKLADLVAVETLREALRFFLDRAGGRTTRQIHELAAAALAIARHWVKVPQDHEQRLRALVRRCDPEQRGMTAKNRALLRQFEDPALPGRFVALPQKLAHGLAEREVLQPREALRLQLALAIEILTIAPLRIANLVGLRLDRDVVRIGHGPSRRVTLCVPREEVKNRQDLEYPLPSSTVALLDRYLERARPVLDPACGPWLFPGERGRHKNKQALSRQIAEITQRELGVRLTAHQFRHVGGHLYLQANPGGHEVVRAVLGHRSIETTIRFYAGMEAASAARHYDQVILGLRRAPQPREAR